MLRQQGMHVVDNAECTKCSREAYGKIYITSYMKWTSVLMKMGLNTNLVIFRFKQDKSVVYINNGDEIKNY